MSLIAGWLWGQREAPGWGGAPLRTATHPAQGDDDDQASRSGTRWYGSAGWWRRGRAPGAGKFAVRVASRNPASDAARALAARGVEVGKGELVDPSTLRSALGGAWSLRRDQLLGSAQMPRETEIGTAAVQAARAAGVKHLIWSTLPDSEKLTGGRVKVAHFTGKARVDAAVRGAGFERHTFVMAPTYLQNFLTLMAPGPPPNAA